MWTSVMTELCSVTAAPGDLRIICDCQRHQEGARIGKATRFVVWGTVLFIAAGIFVSPLGATIPSVEVILDNARSWISWAGAPVEPEPVASLPQAPPRKGWYDGALTSELVREAFFRTQVPYGEIILRESAKNELPPELVAAVVKTESDFRPKLVSNKNAHGLMQIIPSTGQLMGARDLFNPHDNIRTGTKYLRYLYDRYEGDRTMTLAAYNAGLGNVEKYGGVPPFRETQNYVIRVARSNTEYERRIRESTARWNRLALSLRD